MCFFFKQKTAYEMRISDWSSDVCFRSTFRTAFDFIANPCNLWTNGTFDDKRIVLNLTLGSHLKYDWNEGVRTAELSLPFMVLGRLGNREKGMAEREGFEPSIRLPVCSISSAVNSTTLPNLRQKVAKRLVLIITSVTLDWSFNAGHRQGEHKCA